MADKPETPKIDSLPNGRMVDKYKIVKLLGQGGMGAVYLAVDSSGGKEDDFVAIKVLFPHLAVKSGDFTRRFLREARIASKISHPNLVGVVECNFCDDGEFYYIVQEYVGGGTLRQLVSNDTVLSEEDTLTVAIGVARALEAAHKFNVVHRDIKPDNIMFANDGTVKLTDWGIAKKVAVEDAVSVTTLELTAAKVFMGTPLYASPEQIQDTKNVDIRGDIYSLGATMYYSLVGKPPFRGTTEVESLCVILTKPPPDVRKARPDVSDKTAALIKRMLAKTPVERFQNPTELLDVLVDAAKSCALLLHPEGSEEGNGDACAGRMKHQAPGKTSDRKKSVHPFPEDFHTAPMESSPEKTPSAEEGEAEGVAYTTATRYESPSKGPATNHSAGGIASSSDSNPPGTSKPATTPPPDPAGKRFPIGKVILGVISLAVFFGGIWFALRSLQTMKSQFEENLQRRLDEAREMASYRRKELSAEESGIVTPLEPAVKKVPTVELTDQEEAARVALEQAAEKARQEEAARVALEQAAEKARQEEAARVALEQAAEKARQAEAARVALEQAAEKARQAEAAKLAVVQALPERSVSDLQVLDNIKKFLADGESSSILSGSELEATCLRFRDALEMFDQSRQKLAKDDYFRSNSNAMEFIATTRHLWETANELKQDDARKLLRDTAWQQMEICFQQAAENLLNSVSVMRLSLSQQAQAKLFFLRVLAYCDEVSDGKVSAWPEEFSCRQTVSSFFPDVLLQEAIARDDAGQLGIAPGKIAWLQPVLQAETADK